MAAANGLSSAIQGGPGTRERLLGAAISLFSEQGYSATGTRAIAARAGCNVALISHYFGSKEGPAARGHLARHLDRRGQASGLARGSQAGRKPARSLDRLHGRS